jgi:hypothetical protein
MMGLTIERTAQQEEQPAVQKFGGRTVEQILKEKNGQYLCEECRVEEIER